MYLRYWKFEIAISNLLSKTEIINDSTQYIHKSVSVSEVNFIYGIWNKKQSLSLYLYQENQ